MSAASRTYVAPAVWLIILASPIVATAQAGSPRRGQVDLELRLDEPGAYRASIEAEGQTRTCQGTVERGRPCLLTGVPVGRAQVHLEGSGEPRRITTLAIVRDHTRALVIRNGISLDGAYGFTLLGLSVLFAAPGTYLAIAAECTPDDRLCAVTPAVAGVLIALGSGLALTGIYLLTFGDPFALYVGDSRRQTRPAASPEPTINVPVPPRPPEPPSDQPTPTAPPPADEVPPEAAPSSRAPSPRGVSGGVALTANGVVLTMRF